MRALRSIALLATLLAPACDGSNGAAVENASLRLYIGDPANPENTWPVLATAKTAAGTVVLP